jgi:hypothetical protein
MKHLFLSLFFIWMIVNDSFSQNVLTEDFFYNPVDSLENSGLWNRTGLNTIYNIKVVSPGLVYPGYVGSGEGNSCLISNAGNGDIVFQNFSNAIITGAAYLSFMFRVDSLPSTVKSGDCIAFNPYNGGTNLYTRFNIQRFSDSTFTLGVSKRSWKLSNDTFEINKTYLIVLKYSIVDGIENDTSALYVFSNSVPQTEPLSPLVYDTYGEDYTGPGSVYLNNNYAQTGLEGCRLIIDGIRVGNSWESSVLSPVTSTKLVNSTAKILNENYPNPFENNTTIKFELPTKGFVRVDIYNQSGMFCTNLFKGELESGNHKIVWDATHFTSGVYTCRILFNGIAIGNNMLMVK